MACLSGMVYSQPPSTKATPIRSSPIAVPRRKSNHTAPCSPPGDQNSPEFVFNFDFSVSPDAPARMSSFMQNQTTTSQLFPLRQKAAGFLPLSALGNGQGVITHPYASEPFLYSVPKAPLRDSQNTFRPSHADFADDDFALTGAFRAPMVSSSILSSSSSWSDYAPASASSVYPTAAPSPPRPQSPRRVYSESRPRQLLFTRSKVSQRTTAAAPVVSLNVAEAERPLFSSSRHYPYPSNPESRARRRSISTASSGRSAEKPRERSRRMSTVVGRGAGRVVTRCASNMSLVSDEDIERSLEKDDTEVDARPRGRNSSWRQRDNSLEHLAEKDDGREPEPERGRARSRVPLRAPAGDGALPVRQ